MKTLPADLEALMPKPDGYAAMTPNGSIIVPPSRFREVNGYAIFTADQVREAMLAATERAAKLCDMERDEFLAQAANNNGRESDFAFGSVNSAERIASAIRGSI